MLFKFTKALEGELPGRESEEDALTFKKASEVFVHAEGENQKLEKVKEIRIIKTGKSLRVISV